VPHVRYEVEIEIKHHIDTKLFGIVLRETLSRLADVGGHGFARADRKYKVRVMAYRIEESTSAHGYVRSWQRRRLLFQRTKK